MALSATYEAEHVALHETIGDHCVLMPDVVCLHWPIATPTYSGKLLVVGQALNGWHIDEKACRLYRPEVRAERAQRTRFVSEGPTSWKWMTPRPWSRPFWRLARYAMDVLDVRLEEIAWSNLAKVAPAEGGNPGGSLLELQQPQEAFRSKFERDVDPDGVLPLEERLRRAEMARRAYFTRLALRSAQVRRERSRRPAAVRRFQLHPAPSGRAGPGIGPAGQTPQGTVDWR